MANGSAETVNGLDIQMCVMLKGVKGFERRSNDNKIFKPPFAAACDASGRRGSSPAGTAASGPGATLFAPAFILIPVSRTARRASREASEGGCHSMMGQTSKRS